MTTYNTGNPIGSTDARDRLDNTENMDYLENSITELTHPDRLGNVRKTRHGMEVEHDAQISAHESEHDAQIAAHESEHDAQMQSFESDFDGRLEGMAFTRVGAFTTGATLTDMRQVLVWEVSQGGDGHEYGWTGAFPKVVAAGATPATSGGIGAGAWVDRTDVTLRSEINIVQKRFTCVADMVADTSLSVGNIVETVGYYDGWAGLTEKPIGGNKYEIVAAGTGADDGGSYINLAGSGLQAKGLFVDGLITIDRFGAIPNNNAVDNSTAINAALTFGKDVKLGRGMYYIASQIFPPYGSILSGHGTLTYNDYADSGIYQISNCPAIVVGGSVSRVCLRDFIIRGNTLGNDQDGIRILSGGEQYIFENLLIQGMGANGIHATGNGTWGVDLVNVRNVKLKSCSQYGVKINLDSNNPNNFNSALFECVNCAACNLGGWYINKSQSCTFIRCGAFQNSNINLSPCHGYDIRENTKNLVFINCWVESNGEVTNIDASHTSCGFIVRGGTNHKFDHPHSFASSIIFNILGGDNIVIDSPLVDVRTGWTASADIILGASSLNCRVYNVEHDVGAVIANFSSTSYIEYNGDAKSSGRIPFNSNMRKGFRGSAYARIAGTVSPAEYSTIVSGVAGNNYITYTSATLKTGDNITIPGADAAGSDLVVTIRSVDMLLRRYYIDKSISTTVSGVLAVTNRATIYSEVFGNVVPTIGYWYEGDRVNASSAGFTNHPGWLCTASGTPGTWKQMAPLI